MNAKNRTMIKKIISCKLLLITIFINAQIPQKLTDSEKIFGLSQIWKEASYNYAHFKDLKKFSWDSLYITNIAKVKNAQSLIDYYNLLNRFIASLEDGHTRIIPPKEYQSYYDEPALQIMDVENKAIVTEVGEKLLNKIPVGSEILKVNNIEINDFIKRHKYPYIPSSTNEFRRKIAILELLKDKKGCEIEIQLKTPDKEVLVETLICESKEQWYKANRENNKIIDYKWLENDIFYLALNSFGNDKVVNEFKVLLKEISKSKGLIIDLRRNGGGEADLGYSILSYLIDKPHTTYSWKTREHIAKYKAQGKWASYIPLNKVSDEKKTLLKYFSDDSWFECCADTIFPSNESKVIVPTAILIGSFTASAAEDFLVPVTSDERFVIVGEKTAGFTGTPYIFDLPKGGMAMINTSREMYQNGKLIRNGMNPNYVIKPSVDDIINCRDIVLEKGIDVILKRIE